MTDNARAAAIRQNQVLLDLLLTNPAFRCSLSNRLLSDPVVLAGTGLSYDRTTIVTRLMTDPTDPESGRSLDESERRLLPNPMLRNLIRDMIAPVQSTPESEAVGPVPESVTE